jgi:hypothetical protein
VCRSEYFEKLGLPVTFVASVLGFAMGCGTSKPDARPVDQDAEGPSDGGGNLEAAGPSDVGGNLDAGGPSDGGGNRDEADTSTGAKCGSTPTILVDYVPYVPEAGVAVQVPDIAVNATDLYYVLNWNKGLTGTSSVMDGYLMRVPIGGGTAVRLAFIPGGGSQGAQGLVVTPGGAIFSEAPGDDGGAGSIVSVPASGGSASVLASTNGLANALVADDQNVYFVDKEATKSVPLAGGSVRMVAAAVPFSLGVAGPTLYLADLGANTVSSVPIDGGQVNVLAKDQPGPLYPVACGPNLCWVNMWANATSGFSAGNLMQLAPGAPPLALAADFSEPHDLVFDGNNFFVTTGGGGLSLTRVPSAGGTPALVESEIGITSMTLDETCLYWSSLRGISSLARSAADVAGSTDQ